MAKKILAIIAGVITGFIIVFIGDATVHAINPPPLGLNYMDRNVMQNYIAGIPTYVFVIMVIFWLLGSFTGGLIASLIKRSEWRFCAIVTGAILLAAALLNLLMTGGHPVWVWIVTVAGYIPAALLGGSLVRRPVITEVPVNTTTTNTNTTGTGRTS